MDFRNMRRSNKEIFDENIVEILETAEFGVMSVMGENGYPYGIPLNFVYLDGAIYFHCADEGHKLDAIKADNRVSFSVVSGTEIVQQKFTSLYSSVIVFGKAYITTGEEKTKALRGLIYKYSPDFIDEGMKYVDRKADGTVIVKIDIEHMSGKSSFR